MKNIVFIILITFIVYNCSVVPSESIILDVEDYESLLNYKTNKIDTLVITDSIFVLDTVVIKDTVIYNDCYNKPKKVIEIKPINIRVDEVGDSPTSDPMNMIDGELSTDMDDMGTRWLVRGYPHSAMFYFDGVTKIDSIEFNIWKWYQNYYDIIIYNFSDTVATITTKFEKLSGHRISFIGSGLFIEIISGTNNYVDIGEVKFYKFAN